jgi:predicted nucleotidyltransferase
MVAQSVIETVRNYANLIRTRFPVKQVILYGSFARGTQHQDSDIDVAVILEKQPNDILEAETELYKLCRDIDLRIEPIIVEDEPDPSGFYEDISSYGKMIFSAT